MFSENCIYYIFSTLKCYVKYFPMSAMCGWICLITGQSNCGKACQTQPISVNEINCSEHRALIEFPTANITQNCYHGIKYKLTQPNITQLD